MTDVQVGAAERPGDRTPRAPGWGRPAKLRAARRVGLALGVASVAGAMTWGAVLPGPDGHGPGRGHGRSVTLSGSHWSALPALPAGSRHGAALGGSHWSDVVSGSHWSDVVSGSHWSDVVSGSHWSGVVSGSHWSGVVSGSHWSGVVSGSHWSGVVGGDWSSTLPALVRGGAAVVSAVVVP